MIPLTDLIFTCSGPALVIGNGPSAGKVPKKFVASFPSFGMNLGLNKICQVTYAVYYDTRVTPQTADPGPVKYRFVHQRVVKAGVTPPGDNVVLFDNGPFTTYLSTGHWATWIAATMGYSPILLIGVDCSEYSFDPTAFWNVAHKKHGLWPHFYEDAPPVTVVERQETDWNDKWKTVVLTVAGLGAEVYNLSEGTLCTNIPQARWQDFRVLIED